jgi:hypothetical protein
MKRIYKIKCGIFDPIVILFEKLSKICEKIGERLTFCPDCGRNKYRGRPCKNI